MQSPHLSLHACAYRFSSCAISHRPSFFHHHSLTYYIIWQAYIDRAAGNNLREKFATGLFDGYAIINGTALAAGLDLPADRALAYSAATQGIVLLKNDPTGATATPLLPLQGLGTTIKKCVA